MLKNKRNIVLLVALAFILTSCVYKRERAIVFPVFAKKKIESSKDKKRTRIYYFQSPDYVLYDMWEWDNYYIKEKNKMDEGKKPVEDVKQRKKMRYKYTNWR